MLDKRLGAGYKDGEAAIWYAVVLVAVVILLGAIAYYSEARHNCYAVTPGSDGTLTHGGVCRPKRR